MARPAYTEEESAEMRRQLLDAAFSLYFESGFEAVTLRQIAARSGLSHSIVYRYFDNKDSLLAAMRLRCLEEFRAGMAAKDRPDDSPRGRIKAALEGALEFGCRESAKYRLVFSLPQPNLRRYPELETLRRDVFNSCVDLVQAAMDRGELVGDALMLTHGIWSALHGMLSLHTAGQLIHGLSLEQMAEPVIEQLLAGAQPDRVHSSGGPAIVRGKWFAAGVRPVSD